MTQATRREGRGVLLVSNTDAAGIDPASPPAPSGSRETADQRPVDAVLSSLVDAADAELDRFLADSRLCRLTAAALVSRASQLVWSGSHGDVSLQVLATSGEAAWTTTIRFGPAGIALVEADPGQADVRLSLGVRALVGLAAGREDGALLYLANRLRIDGDASLLLAIAGALRRPGSGTALIDPAALVPEAVAAAIKDVSTAHLDAVMAGAFRQLVLEEVFGRLPDFVIAEKAARVRLVVAFEIEPSDRYVVHIGDGTGVARPDPAGEIAGDVTLVLTGAQFLRLVLGHLNPVRAVLSGEVRVRGELMKALAFNSVMRIPGI